MNGLAFQVMKEVVGFDLSTWGVCGSFTAKAAARRVWTLPSLPRHQSNSASLSFPPASKQTNFTSNGDTDAHPRAGKQELVELFMGCDKRAKTLLKKGTKTSLMIKENANKTTDGRIGILDFIYCWKKALIVHPNVKKRGGGGGGGASQSP